MPAKREKKVFLVIDSMKEIDCSSYRRVIHWFLTCLSESLNFGIFTVTIFKRMDDMKRDGFDCETTC